MHVGRPRAQGRASIPWPAGLGKEDDICAVALEVILATVKGGKIDEGKRVAWVGWGAARATLEKLIGQGVPPARKRHPLR